MFISNAAVAFQKGFDAHIYTQTAPPASVVERKPMRESLGVSERVRMEQKKSLSTTVVVNTDGRVM